ncbi:MAG: hypothetical protein ACRDNZ_08285 [Streptosporangiaceae bacterium]
MTFGEPDRDWTCTQSRGLAGDGDGLGLVPDGDELGLDADAEGIGLGLALDRGGLGGAEGDGGGVGLVVGLADTVGSAVGEGIVLSEMVGVALGAVVPEGYGAGVGADIEGLGGRLRQTPGTAGERCGAADVPRAPEVSARRRKPAMPLTVTGLTTADAFTGASSWSVLPGRSFGTHYVPRDDAIPD